MKLFGIIDEGKFVFPGKMNEVFLVEIITEGLD